VNERGAIVRNSPSALGTVLAGAVIVLSSSLAQANDQKAEALPKAPLLADPLLTNPLLVDGSLGGHCWGGPGCTGGIVAISPDTGAPLTTNVSPMTAAPDFFSSILAPSSSSAGNAGAGGTGGGAGIGTIARLSGGSLDTSNAVLPTSLTGAGQGIGGTAPSQNAAGAIRTSTTTVPGATTTTGPLSQLVTGNQGPEVAPLIVDFVGPASTTSPNFTPSVDIVPVSVTTKAPEPGTLGLFAGGLMILGMAGWVRWKRGRAQTAL
jgi:hypothetical protein